MGDEWPLPEGFPEPSKRDLAAAERDLFKIAAGIKPDRDGHVWQSFTWFQDELLGCRHAMPTIIHAIRLAVEAGELRRFMQQMVVTGPVSVLGGPVVDTVLDEYPALQVTDVFWAAYTRRAKRTSTKPKGETVAKRGRAPSKPKAMVVRMIAEDKSDEEILDYATNIGYVKMNQRYLTQLRSQVRLGKVKS